MLQNSITRSRNAGRRRGQAEQARLNWINASGDADGPQQSRRGRRVRGSASHAHWRRRQPHHKRPTDHRRTTLVANTTARALLAGREAAVGSGLRVVTRNEAVPFRGALASGRRRRKTDKGPHRLRSGKRYDVLIVGRPERREHVFGRETHSTGKPSDERTSRDTHGAEGPHPSGADPLSVGLK